MKTHHVVFGEYFGGPSGGDFFKRKPAFFGHAPRLEFLPYAEWANGVAAEDAQATWEHITRSPCHSIDKGRRLIGYAPRYTSLQAVQEAVM